MPEILPCAFKRGRPPEICGGEPYLEDISGPWGACFYARCRKCGSSTGVKETSEAALEEWNRWQRIERREER